MTDWILNQLIWLPAILIGLTFHEYAHGQVADWLGDDTPYYQGRLTLNPLPHIDWVGFFMLLFFHFGWAKPVQVNPYNFKQTGVKRGMMLVSLAGPTMNFLIALTGMGIMRLAGIDPLGVSTPIGFLLWTLVYINIILGVFNLIPVPPLDGSKILAGLLPDSGAQIIYALEQYGFIILLILIVSGAFSGILVPLVETIFGLFYQFFF